MGSFFFYFFPEKEQMQPPKFVERMQNFTVNEGQPMTLTCQLTGVPVPMISWQKDGKMLTPSSPYQYEFDHSLLKWNLQNSKYSFNVGITKKS